MNQLSFPVVRPPAPRHEVSIATTLSYDGQETSVELRDISTEGAKLALAAALDIGAAVQLRLPDKSRIPATVRWTRDGHAGLRFAADLPEDQVLEITRI